MVTTSGDCGPGELVLATQAPVHMQTQTQMEIGITMASTRMVTAMPMAILMPRDNTPVEEGGTI